VVKVCGLCGHPLPSLEVTGNLTKQQNKILIELDNAGQRGLTIDRLAEILHAHDPSGGPEFALQSLRVQFAKMKHILKPFGLRIACDRNSVRRLEKI
jgi:hypothetical protein